MKSDFFSDLNEKILKEKKINRELNSMFIHLNNTKEEREKDMLFSQIKQLKDSLKKTNEDVKEIVGKIIVAHPLMIKKSEVQKKEKKTARLKVNINNLLKKAGLSNIEKETLKRLRKRKKKIIKKKIKKPSSYIKTANRFFLDFSRSLIKKKRFQAIEKNLIKTNLEFTPTSYISLLIFTTLLSGIVSFFIFVFLLFFNFGVEFPIITKVTESIGARFLKVIWILFAIPLGTFLFMYFYPLLEKKSAEYQIDQELPFATIHMSAISGSMLEPSKIFSIIISTKEYPFLEKEFIKIINEINIYGYDLVAALRKVATNTSSKKLSELLNSLATTITSGGNLANFFDKRAQSLLFDYRLEREKYTKTVETFMDIYISVVIAAPMILMLLLMMIRISGLGISLSSSMITLAMILGVSLINIIFLTFLHLKQPKG